MAKENEIAKLKELLKPRMKELLENAEIRIKTIKDGYIFESVECELVPDFKSGNMNFIDVKTGEIVFNRTLLPNERQLTITHNIKTA